jgi:hypothetical protein
VTAVHVIALIVAAALLGFEVSAERRCGALEHSVGLAVALVSGDSLPPIPVTARFSRAVGPSRWSVVGPMLPIELPSASPNAAAPAPMAPSRMIPPTTIHSQVGIFDRERCARFGTWTGRGS